MSSNRSKNLEKPNLALYHNAFHGITLFCLFVSIPVFFTDCPAAVSAVGTVTAMRGHALIKRPGVEKAYSAQKGETVAAGDDIRTEENSMVQITFTDEAFVNLSSDSAMRVDQYSFDIEQNRRTARLNLLKGRARFILYEPRSPDSAFYVKTNIALVTATTIADFGLTVEPHQTEVSALDHAVGVNNIWPLAVGNVWLSANQKTVVKEKTAPSKPVALMLEERRSYMKDVRRLTEQKK